MNSQEESVNHRNIVGIHERVKAQDKVIRDLNDEVKSAKALVTMLQAQVTDCQQQLAMLRQQTLGNGATSAD